MKKLWLIMLVIVVVVLGLVIFFIQKYAGGLKQNPGYGCFENADCVKDSCCHATGCTSIDNAPDCTGILCTQECKPNSLDCGGSCECVNNKCKGVVLGGV